MRVVFAIAATYLLIGLMVAALAVASDKDFSWDAIGVVPVVVILWPFWLFLKIVFGG